MNQVDPTIIPSDGPTRPKGSRTRGEIDRDRAAQRNEIEQQIDRLAEEFHRLLPRSEAQGIAAAYARHSSRFQHSVVDQIRTLFEAALKQKIFIPREHVCYDIAISGYKVKRKGLNRLRELLAGGGVTNFLVFSTNRLFRKTYQALQFVEEEVVQKKIRCHGHLAEDTAYLS